MQIPYGSNFAAAEPSYLAVTTGSQQFALALLPSTQYVFVADVDCYIKVAANPTASVASGSQYVPANVPWPVVTVTNGDKVGCIGTIAGNATLTKLVAKLTL